MYKYKGKTLYCTSSPRNLAPHSSLPLLIKDLQNTTCWFDKYTLLFTSNEKGGLGNQFEHFVVIYKSCHIKRVLSVRINSLKNDLANYLEFWGQASIHSIARWWESDIWKHLIVFMSVSQSQTANPSCCRYKQKMIYFHQHHNKVCISNTTWTLRNIVFHYFVLGLFSSSVHEVFIVVVS